MQSHAKVPILVLFKASATAMRWAEESNMLHRYRVSRP